MKISTGAAVGIVITLWWTYTALFSMMLERLNPESMMILGGILALSMTAIIHEILGATPSPKKTATICVVLVLLTLAIVVLNEEKLINSPINNYKHERFSTDHHFNDHSSGPGSVYQIHYLDDLGICRTYVLRRKTA